MKVPCSWLAEYCDPGLAPEEIAERLSMTGTEVERIGRAGAPSPESFVVGRVLAAAKHPDADRLRVCEVDVGEPEPRTIVCGAPNVAAGQTVPVALPGAVMPSGQRLGKAKLRGVVSDGMILSEAELEIGEEAGGIAVLADDGGADPGTPLTELVAVSEPVLELEVTPNRPDCLGVYGVARELHAITGAPLAEAPWSADQQAGGADAASDHASVSVEVPRLCPRFTARVFAEVRVGPSPLWLKARLVAAGQRPINNVVDITNYVMLLTGQPLHAFDLDLVAGSELIVRTARDGELLTTLDGVERSFDPETVLVCDGDGPAAIAGIMGGERSEVSEATTRVLLEVANWDGVNILRTSNRLGLRSEASTRFEKQLHPDLTMRAQAIASRLLVELCGARLVPGTIDVAAEPPPRRSVALRGERTAGLLGMEIALDSQATYLERLGFGIGRRGGEVEVTVPADRYHDVSREADLIEEVARIHGIDEHLPTTLPGGAHVGEVPAPVAFRRQAEDLMRGMGFDEIVSWSFVDPALWERLGLGPADGESVAIHNPLSGEGSVMRQTLLGGLLDAASRNVARGAEGPAVFESGRVYLRRAPSADGEVLAGGFLGSRPAPVAEPHRLAGLATGPRGAADWRAADPAEADFFSIKAALEQLAGALGAEIEVRPKQRPFLHPGRSATILVGGSDAGWLGELHPRVAQRWDLGRTAAFELELAALLAARPAARTYADVITYPAIRRDIAVVVPEEVSFAEVEAAVRRGGGELLRSVHPFDLYRGEQVGEGRKSLALRLEFRAPDRTLTDEEANERRRAITAELAEIGGSLRE